MVEEEQSLVKVDVEEGEIWDSASVEEISEEEEDFSTKQAPATSPANNSGDGRGSGARVWTMRDVQKYQIASKTSFSGLYNLAWAQAVNNKPLDDVFVMMEDGINPKSDDDKFVIDVDELEEGEIDLDSNDMDVGMVKEEVGGDVDEQERIRRAGLVKEELQNIHSQA